MKASKFARRVAYLEEAFDKETEREKQVAAGTHVRIEREGRWGEPDMDYVWRKPRDQRPECGAKCRTRAGRPCRAKVCIRKNGTFAKRCKMHGGRSTGPVTDEGRARIAESNRRRAMLRAAMIVD